MNITSNGAVTKSSVAGAEAHRFLFRPCVILLFVLLMLLVPAV